MYSLSNRILHQHKKAPSPLWPVIGLSNRSATLIGSGSAFASQLAQSGGDVSKVNFVPVITAGLAANAPSVGTFATTGATVMTPLIDASLNYSLSGGLQTPSSVSQFAFDAAANYSVGPVSKKLGGSVPVNIAADVTFSIISKSANDLYTRKK